MKIQTLKISEIKPYAKNPRRAEKATPAVAESIKRFGFLQPIVVDGEGVIACGHARYFAAKRLGMTEIPCVLADDLSPEAIRAFRLLDNKLREKSSWDPALLAEELAALAFDFAPFDVDFTTDLELEFAPVPDELPDELPDEPADDPPKFDDRDDRPREKDGAPHSYRLVVECEDEEDQETLYNRLVQEGYKVKPCTL